MTFSLDKVGSATPMMFLCNILDIGKYETGKKRKKVFSCWLGPFYPSWITRN